MLCFFVTVIMIVIRIFESASGRPQERQLQLASSVVPHFALDPLEQVKPGHADEAVSLLRDERVQHRDERVCEEPHRDAGPPRKGVPRVAAVGILVASSRRLEEEGVFWNFDGFFAILRVVILMMMMML